ncbi:hypothetical protein [Leptothoe kymatousa]|uniref:Uncharacterized protein n=1 Tax=Leptothoe kymatousa TAU-MAC 1615 TaxID=2364775 RepID=A0ABS5Y7C3_9CYAN|nr:hypothetical protein [Leptothoe kymatousa]MBT9313697.1 hypothetical protein [Leptothoe kymatousa TAU-MAC 1615]
MGFQLFSSLALTLVICFMLPAIVVGVAFGALTLGAWSPLSAISELGRSHLADFLITFGAGNLGHGIVVICLTISIVGGMFEMFTFYKYIYLK